MHEKEVADIFSAHGLPFGSCSYPEVAFSKEPSRFKTVLTVILPYWFQPEGAHNISVYAMLPDYHLVLGDILRGISAELEKLFPNSIFEPHVDVSPINEKKAAVLSGLGFIGRNSLLINGRYGSFVFIGDICTDAEINLSSAPVSENCGDCDLCVRACPGQALCGGFNADRCVSAITQKKGELSEAEVSVIAKGGSAWGCDVCSLVCPYNKGLELSRYAAKYKDRLIYNVEKEQLLNLTNGEFRRTFGDRAFVWRGISTLKRNLDILENLE